MVNNVVALKYLRLQQSIITIISEEKKKRKTCDGVIIFLFWFKKASYERDVLFGFIQKRWQKPNFFGIFLYAYKNHFPLKSTYLLVE